MRTHAGITLVEMLVVIGILTVLLGLGVASYIALSRSYKEEGAVSQVDVMLRQTRNSAVSFNAEAHIEIDAEHNRITPWATRTVALWHFEDVDDFGHTSGSKHNATLRGAKQFRDGKIGKCALVSSSGYIDAGEDPDFDLDDGGVLECYIRPTTYTFAGDNYIFSKNGAYALKIGTGGVLVGEIAASAKYPGVKVVTRTYRIVPGRWTKVALAWDRNVTRIMADDLVLATGPGARAPISTNPLTIGHETGGFEGLVDEVKILSAVSGGALELEKQYKITHNTSPWNAVYFAGDGTLDMRFHAGPVRIEVERERRVRAVTVNMFGTTQRIELERKDKPPEKYDEEDPAEAARKKKETAKKVKLAEN